MRRPSSRGRLFPALVIAAGLREPGALAEPGSLARVGAGVAVAVGGRRRRRRAATRLAHGS